MRNNPAFAPLPPEHAIIEQAKANAPSFKDIRQLVGTAPDGSRVMVVKSWFDPRNKTWYVGVMGRCGGTQAPAAMQAAIRAEFGRYTNAPVVFEPAVVGVVPQSTISFPSDCKGK